MVGSAAIFQGKPERVFDQVFRVGAGSSVVFGGAQVWRRWYLCVSENVCSMYGGVELMRKRRITFSSKTSRLFFKSLTLSSCLGLRYSYLLKKVS